MNKLYDLLKEQIDISKGLEQTPRNSPEFKKWKRDTEVYIEKIFWKEWRHLNDFTKINYWLIVFWTWTPDYEWQNAYIKGLKNAQMILQSMLEELEKFWSCKEQNELKENWIDIVKNLCHRFFSVARQIRNRYDSRETLEINDEYDVQDLFHALLQINFEDIRPEEWTPSYAWTSSRVDFLLKNEEIVIEIKMTRKWLDRKEAWNQLIIDKARYKNHTNCKFLVCFVYDPEWRIWNPIWFENDLSSDDGWLETIVIVAPKWR